MKKVLAVVITLAMLVPMFAMISNAANGVCFDGAFFTNDAAPGTHVPGENDKNVQAEAGGTGDLGSVYGLGYKYFHAQGWIGDSDEYTDIGIAINGGAIEWGKGIEDKNLWDEAGKSRTGFAYNFRYNINLEVLEGKVTIELYEKMADGSEKVAKTLSYTNEAADPNVKTYSNKAIGGADNNIGVWIKGENNYATIKFTTAGGFTGFGVPIYWASNKDQANGPFAQYKVELFKFDENTEKTLAGTPVKSADIQGEGDNKPALSINFDEALEAGTYIARFTLVNYDQTEMLQQAGVDDEPKEKAPYLVLPKMNNGNPDATKFEFNVEPFNFFVVGEDGIDDFYAANPEDVATPDTHEDQPQTGDMTVAMFAVIAVLALGAVVVFSKKRAF